MASYIHFKKPKRIFYATKTHQGSSHSRPMDGTIVWLKRKAVLFLCCLLQFFMLNVYAQNKTVTGVVRNDKGQPLQAATVTVKGSTNSTSTDVNGKFSIEVPAGSAVLTNSSY